MVLSSLNTGSTDLRETEVQQPNTADDLVLGDQLARLLGEQRPVGGRIDDDGLELLAEQAALLVLLVDQHQHHVLQRRLADRHGAGERMEDADLDRVLGLGGNRRRQPERKPGRGGEPPARRSVAGRPHSDVSIAMSSLLTRANSLRSSRRPFARPAIASRVPSYCGATNPLPDQAVCRYARGA